LTEWTLGVGVNDMNAVLHTHITDLRPIHSIIHIVDKTTRRA